MITKHGEGFYSIDGVHYGRHMDGAGRALVPGPCTLAFRFPDDHPGTNLDPVELLQVIAQHLAGKPAASHILDAIDELNASSPNESASGVSPEGGNPLPSRSRRKSPPQPS